jgi:uncharacterized protein
MRPGAAAICEGTVVHRRRLPVEHTFSYPITCIWLDPDAPEELTAPHPLWSHRWPSLARFRRADYGSGEGRLGAGVLDELGAVLGRRPSGPVRMLTQPRMWGWLFNPITVYVVWDSMTPHSEDDRLVGAVLEVTNTPWKERHRYVTSLAPHDGLQGPSFEATIPKVLHVSPFLDEEFEYRMQISGGASGSSLELAIDVARPGEAIPVLETGLRLALTPATRSSLGRALWRHPLPTHRVSFGIHRQALALWRRGVSFVPHPRRLARTP